MGTVQMVVAIPLCCGRLVFPYFCNIGHFISLNGIPWSLDSWAGCGDVAPIG